MPPVLKLYEPPLDTGDGDDDVPEVPPETRIVQPASDVAASLKSFLLCLLIGTAVTAASWFVAESFVP